MDSTRNYLRHGTANTDSNTGTQNAAWEAYAGAYGCIGFGYNSNFSVGDGSIYYAPGNICGGGNNYPYLNFRPVSGGGAVYEPANILFGWSSADGQGAPDTGLSRDSAAVVDVGNGAVGDKTGAMKMASLFLGIASDPGSPSNGQLWYNSTSNLLKAYINGATVALGGGGGGSTGIPFIPIQEGGGTNGSNGTNYTYTFPQAAAASGNTLFILASADGSGTVNCPSGWTADFNITAATYSRLMLCQKTSASDTSAAFTMANSSTISVYFWELPGSRTFDQLATATVTETPVFRTPNLTPTAGSFVFSAAGIVNNNGGISTYYSPLVYSQFLTDPTWKSIFVGSNAGGSRTLSAFVSQISATGTLLTPPLNSNGAVVPFSGGGLTEATFSIK